MKAIKWFFLIAIAVPLGVLVVGVGLLLIIDPAEYREEFEQIALRAGVKISLEGDINWSFYPTIGIELQDVSLYESTTSNSKLIQADEARLSLQLAALLKGEVQADGILLSGFQANLATDARGNGNWQQLVGQKEGLSEDQKLSDDSITAQKDIQQLPEINIRNISVTDSTINFFDGQNRQTWKLDIDSFLISEFTTNQPFGLQTQATILGNDIEAEIELDSLVTVDDKITRIKIEDSELTVSANISQPTHIDTQATITYSADIDLKKTSFLMPLRVEGDVLLPQISEQDRQQFSLQTTLSGNYGISEFKANESKIHVNAANALLNGRQDIHLQIAAIDAALESQSVDIREAQLSLDKLKTVLSGSLNGFANAEASGSIRILPLNPKKLLKSVFTQQAVSLPEMAAKSVSSFSLNADIQFRENIARLNNMLMQVDNSSLQGNIGYNLGRNLLQADLSLDHIVLDDYLTKQQQTQALPESQSKSQRGPITYSKDPLLPLHLLNIVYAEILLKTQSLVIKNQPVDNLTLDINSKPLILRATARANIFSGRAETKVSLDRRGGTLSTNVNAKLNKIDVAQLLAMALEDEYFAGNITLSTDIIFTGNSLFHWMHSASGPFSLSLNNGRILPVNISRQVCKLISTAADEKKDWDSYSKIKEMVLFARFRNGKAELSNTRIDLEDISGVASGQFKLPTLDFFIPVGITVTSSGVEQHCQPPQKIAQIQWPLQCKGNLLTTEPLDFCAPDYQKISELIESRVNEEKEKIQEQLQGVVEQEKEKIENELKEKLRDLF